MNPLSIVKIIIILLELIARGLDNESAINTLASKYNISATLLRKFL
jgi:hypothetical protein